LRKKNVAAVAALLVATLAFTGCAEISELTSRLSLRESETQPVLIDSGEAQVQVEDSVGQTDASVETLEESTPAPQESTGQEMPSASAASLNLDGPKGTVVELTVVVYGTPENDNGKLLFHAVPQDDETICMKISVLNDPQLEISEGDIVTVVGILTDPCSGIDKAGADKQMPLIAATDVTILTQQTTPEPSAQESAAPAEPEDGAIQETVLPPAS